jgi:hypothetical protein
MATDITAQAGKGPRPHRNVSTRAYREGYEAIFERCQIHSAYRGMRPPRCACSRCWEIWQRARANPDKCDCCTWSGGFVCGAKAINWVCTRPKGHEGDHVACGGARFHRVWVWPATPSLVCLCCGGEKFRLEPNAVIEQIFRGEIFHITTAAMVCFKCGWITVDVTQADTLVSLTKEAYARRCGNLVEPK